MEDKELHDVANKAQVLLAAMDACRIPFDRGTALALFVVGTELLVDDGMALEEMQSRLEFVVGRIKAARTAPRT